VAGRWKGRFPEHVIVRGRMPDGTPFELRAVTQTSDVVPVSRVFLKQRLDLLSANAWLHNSKEIEEEVVALSCTHSLPSPYTAMVCALLVNRLHVVSWLHHTCFLFMYSSRFKRPKRRNR